MGNNDLENLEDTTHEDIELWTKDMVEVQAYQTIVERVCTGNAWTFLLGNAGEGKTTLGYMCLKKLKDRDFKVFRVIKPKHYFKIHDTGYEKCVIMLNDVLGAFDFDHGASGKWEDVFTDFLDRAKRLKEANKQPKLQVIFISRTYVLEKAKNVFERYGSVSGKDSVVDLSKTKCDKERHDMLEYHLRKHNITDVSEHSKDAIVKGSCPHGFPHCSQLYAEIRSSGVNIDIGKFFTSPLMFLGQTIKELMKRDVNKKLFKSLLTSSGGLEFARIKDDDIREAAMCLQGSYTSKHGGWLTFSHPSILESVSVVYGQLNPQFVIDSCEFTIIMHKMRLRREGVDTISDQYIYIDLTPTIIDSLCKRFNTELLDMNYSELEHDFFRSADFCNALLDCALYKDKAEEAADMRRWESVFDHYSTLKRGTNSKKIFPAGLQQLMREHHIKSEIGSNRLYELQRYAAHGISKGDFVKITRSKFNIDKARFDVGLLLYNGVTLLMAAVRMENVTLIRSLLQRGASVNIQDRDGMTPLHWYVYKTPADVDVGLVDMLLSAGADVNIQDWFGMTPLQWYVLTPADRVDVRLVDMFLTAGSDINLPDIDGTTAKQRIQRIARTNQAIAKLMSKHDISHS